MKHDKLKLGAQLGTKCSAKYCDLEVLQKTASSSVSGTECVCVCHTVESNQVKAGASAICPLKKKQDNYSRKELPGCWKRFLAARCIDFNPVRTGNRIIGYQTTAARTAGISQLSCLHVSRKRVVHVCSNVPKHDQQSGWTNTMISMNRNPAKSGVGGAKSFWKSHDTLCFNRCYRSRSQRFI